MNVWISIYIEMTNDLFNIVTLKKNLSLKKISLKGPLENLTSWWNSAPYTADWIKSFINYVLIESISPPPLLYKIDGY